MSELTQADEYLLSLIRQGNAQAWSELVDRFQGRLAAFAHQKARRKADAEDLVQETFLSFLKSLASFRGQASLETYLFTILRHKITDVFRRARDNPCQLADVLGEGREEPSMNGSDQWADSGQTASWYARNAEIHEQQEVVLADALRDLIGGYKKSNNFRDLQIVEMLFYCQLRNKDVAELIGIDEKHIAIVKHRGIARLKEAVAKQTRDLDSDPPDVLLSRIWQSRRLSCLKRSTIGAYVLGTLEHEWQAYVAFHLDRLGCQFCLANLRDLNEELKQESRQVLTSRIMESTVGFLSNREL